MAYDKIVDSAVLDAGLTSVADAIRQKGGTSATLAFPQGFVDAIGNISGGGEDEPWVRPSDWPDIDSLFKKIEGDVNCLYLTYDLRKTPGYAWIGVYCQVENRGVWKVERGHVSDGSFIVDEEFRNISSDTYFRNNLDSSNGDVQLWRITSDGHITSYGFVPNSNTTSDNYLNIEQPCVERAGTLPWCTSFGSEGSSNTATSKSGGTLWLEHDHIVLGKLANVTSMSRWWSDCYSLKSIDLSGFDTSNWSVKSMDFCWQNCHSLKSIDLSGFDTSNWQITTMRSCWASCSSLEELDISMFDTTNWKVTNTSSMVGTCYHLKRLILPASLGIVSTATSNTSGHVPNNCYLIEYYSGTETFINHTLSTSRKLTRQSLVSIFERLPTTTTSRTITIGSSNIMKLTNDEVAIATSKGWTVK